MDEKEIIQSIVLYRDQLSSIQNLYKDDNVNHHEFVEMEQALLDIIKLKEESLIAMKKSKLLLLVDDYLTPTSQKGLTTEEEYKFRVKFSQYVQPRYHDAVLFDDNLSDDEIKVLFTHPIVEAMKPCHYFMEGSCHNEQCKFSHGFIVSRSLLLPYHEPNYVNIKPGMLCLAENVDTQLWYIGNIEFVDFESQKVIVKPIQSNQDPSEVAISSIRPLDGSEEDQGNESPHPATVSKGHHTIALPQMNPLNRPIKPDNIKDNMLGDWEVHTRGIGSHLLQKMGFTEGQGLGKYNQGIKEPVKTQPVKRLSHKNLGLGKSSTHGIKNNLAKISPNTSTDLYGQIDEDNDNQSNTITPSVFTYINTQLKTNQAKGNSSCEDKPEPRTVATDKELRIMEIKLDKDIVQCRKEVVEIRGHLKRHSPSSTNKLSHTQDGAILTHYQQKLNTATAKLERLESKVQNIRRSQDQKEERKRLRIF